MNVVAPDATVSALDGVSSILSPAPVRPVIVPPMEKSTLFAAQLTETFVTFTLATLPLPLVTAQSLSGRLCLHRH